MSKNTRVNKLVDLRFSLVENLCFKNESYGRMNAKREEEAHSYLNFCKTQGCQVQKILFLASSLKKGDRVGRRWGQGCRESVTEIYLARAGLVEK